jgi:adenine deaminase
MPFGVSFKEWKDLQSAGLTPTQCLKMATKDAAAVLGMEDQLGTLEAGKLADLVIYQHDPIKNPYNFKTIKTVFKDGRAYPAGLLEYPAPFDLDHWIDQWEKTEFKKGWLKS